MQSKGDRDKRSRVEEDLALIARVEAGSTPHWHSFVDRYAGLIYSVIRRQLFAEDEDEIRDVFVEVLDTLYNGKLGEYEGRSELSTWLIVISRGKALDYLRKRDGRRKLPVSHDQLSPLEQDVFRLHHVEGLGFEAVIHTLASTGQRVSADDIANAVIRIESLMDRHYLNRLEYNAKAPTLGIVSGRLLDFLNGMQIQYERPRADAPDQILERRELEAMGRRVRLLLAEMSDEEQEIMRLRFDEGWTARRISDELDLGGQRRVYTVIDRVVRAVRNRLNLK
ncbi:MAG: sigma-70 family RNA polymerase sigma factor [Candidatus Krumholzibacteriota bacterium]|nr:sigma-70 family RNA polymerase sigma factor [Candidatus Krumholzibacteriota bacterium]